MVVHTPVRPRTRPRLGAGTPMRVRPATVGDVPSTAALELAGAGALRLLPGLVRWQHRLAVRQPGTVTLVWERLGPDGRAEVAGFLAGTRRGVVDLLVTDGGPDAEDGAGALVAVYRRRCTRDASRA